MTTSNLLDNKIVKFYGSSFLYKQGKKLVTEQVSKVYAEGRKASFEAHAITENPYNKEDGNYIWSNYDCWVEGYLSTGRY